MNVLIADDNRINLLLLNQVLEELNCNVIQANNGLDAVEKFKIFYPSLCLLDIMMPEMDGIEAAKRIKELNPETMIIFVSALNGDQDLLRGLDIAFDYITKPIIVSVFTQKINNILENLKLKTELKKKQKETEELLAIINEEHEIGLSLVEKMQTKFLLPNEEIDFYTESMSLFSGDLVLSIESLDSIYKYVLLIDAVGHGLPAAINIFPIYQPFESMAKKGLSVKLIIEELNSIIKKTMPISRFLASTLIRINQKESNFEIWSGGIPSCFKINLKNKSLQEIKPTGTPLGLNMEIEVKEFKISKDDQLIIFSDGIWENECIDYNIIKLIKNLDFAISAKDNVNKIQKIQYFNDDATLIKVKLK